MPGGGSKNVAAKTTTARPSPAAPSPQKKKAAPGVKKKVSGSIYTVQVAAVKTAGDADRLVARLKKQGFSAYRVIGKVPGKGIWYRVRVGKYASKSEARRTLEKLQRKGLKPILVKK